MLFRYRVRDRKGKVYTGEIEENSREAAVGRLRKKGYFVTAVEKAAENRSDLGFRFGIDRRKLAAVTHQLAAMVASGLPLDAALKTAAEQESSPRLVQVLNELRAGIEQGEELTDVMRKWPRIFPGYYVSLVGAGLRGGMLGEGFARAADTLIREARLKDRIRSEMLYPLILLIATILVTVYLTVYILPLFSDLFGKVDSNLPLLTSLFLDLSTSIRSYYLYLLGLGFASVFLMIQSWHHPRFREFRIGVLFRLPWLGDLVLKTAVCSAGRILGELLASGLPLDQALEAIRRLFRTPLYQNSIALLIQQVSEGNPLSASEAFPLGRRMPPLVFSILAAGEEAGRLSESLILIADYYEQEIEQSLKRMIALIEPVLILGIGLVVGTVLLAGILPLLEMMEHGF